MAKKATKKATQKAIVEREPLTISEVATILELAVVKLNGAIKRCSDDAIKDVLRDVAGHLSEVIEADTILSLRPIDNLAV